MVFEKVKGIIVDQLGVDEDQVVIGASFIEDLGADSLDIVELIMSMEDEFGVDIPDTDAEKTYTRKTNQNIVRRLELIKSYVDEFLETNPGWGVINEFKYQTFAARAIEQIPF